MIPYSFRCWDRASISSQYSLELRVTTPSWLPWISASIASVSLMSCPKILLHSWCFLVACSLSLKMELQNLFLRASRLTYKLSKQMLISQICQLQKLWQDTTEKSVLFFLCITYSQRFENPDQSSSSQDFLECSAPWTLWMLWLEILQIQKPWLASIDEHLWQQVNTQPPSDRIKNSAFSLEWLQHIGTFYLIDSLLGMQQFYLSQIRMESLRESLMCMSGL